MSPRQITLAVIPGMAGLVVASWGLAMALGAYPRLEPLTVAAVLAGGLGLVALTFLWLASLLVADHLRRKPGNSPPQAANSPAGVHLPNREELLQALANFQEEALNLIERRREIHHLNTQQWHYVHDRETTAEIQATKKYRSAKKTLELELENAPPPFWPPVEWFTRTVERGLAEEIYALPGEPVIHGNIQQHRDQIAHMIDEIVSGVAGR